MIPQPLLSSTINGSPLQRLVRMPSLFSSKGSIILSPLWKTRSQPENDNVEKEKWKVKKAD
jgi:hypothetical protein